jgi:hypothetical protein
MIFIALANIVKSTTGHSDLWVTTLTMTAALLLLSGIKKDSWFKRLLSKWILKRMQKKKSGSRKDVGWIGLLGFILLLSGPILLLVATGSGLSVIAGILSIAGLLLLIVWGTLKKKNDY